MTRSFDDEFVALFDAQFGRIFAVINRLAGDPDAANDIAQESFVRLWRRGRMPDQPAAWLVTVALNLFRNMTSKRSRHLRLLGRDQGVRAMADPPVSPQLAASHAEAAAAIRTALSLLSNRDREMLLLRAEGYSYAEIAAVLKVSERSLGTMLSRAKASLLRIIEESRNASGR